MLHLQDAATSIKQATLPAVEIPVLLQQRKQRFCWGKALRRQVALLLLDESGAVSGGYKNGKQLDAQQARSQLTGALWEQIPPPGPDAWAAEVLDLGDDG